MTLNLTIPSETRMKEMMVPTKPRYRPASNKWSSFSSNLILTRGGTRWRRTLRQFQQAGRIDQRLQDKKQQ